jgi:hypothetical protein
MVHLQKQQDTHEANSKKENTSRWLEALSGLQGAVPGTQQEIRCVDETADGQKLLQTLYKTRSSLDDPDDLWALR